MKEDRCLDLKEVATRLGNVSVKTIRRLIDSQALVAVRIRGRVFVRESDLAAYISSL